MNFRERDWLKSASALSRSRSLGHAKSDRPTDRSSNVDVRQSSAPTFRVCPISVKAATTLRVQAYNFNIMTRTPFLLDRFDPNWRFGSENVNVRSENVLRAILSTKMIEALRAAFLNLDRS